MTVVERPLSEVRGSHRATGDGVTMVAQGYRKGTRLDAPTHREAQLVYAARGTMQVTTPKGRWLVPPDRAVWVPARLPHAIDVLADIEMRTLYFDLAWLKRERCGTQLTSEFVVRVSAENSRDSVRAEVPTSCASVSISWALAVARRTISAARRQRASWGSGMKVAQSSA